MATHVRSFSKINLGLAIGPVREDGFHELNTIYQTLALHDIVTVSAARAAETTLTLASNHPWVPPDARNTAWRMVERCLKRLGVTAVVKVRIQKNLPIQGGMGAGSANAAAALFGLERELGLALPGPERLELAAEIGSDVPLFLIGGAVRGAGRGEEVSEAADMPETACVIALPDLGVSTPQAFRDWDKLAAVTEAGPALTKAPSKALTETGLRDSLDKLSVTQAFVPAESGTSGIFCKPNPQSPEDQKLTQGRHEKQLDEFDLEQGILQHDLAENTLLALVRTGIENDFERVVFPIHPSLRELKRRLLGSEPADSDRTANSDLGSSAVYAALSGSGSALFGLYRSKADAEAAQQRVQAAGCRAVITHTLPRAAYWRTMFAG